MTTVTTTLVKRDQAALRQQHARLKQDLDYCPHYDRHDNQHHASILRAIRMIECEMQQCGMRVRCER